MHLKVWEEKKPKKSGLLIHQEMGGGRESCAAKATFAPQALQSR
ncbi:hypothetical protein JOD24_001485 [Kroppenstedtia sanguinis]|uniref:Uncharacterized protein n=1 Tax=Kroppenstedtia sanguinis TaxID=1380684 RepID=A0ABW4CCT7_9BACL